MRDSERYMAQAEAVLRMAARAGSGAEREVYGTIAEGWRKLAAEARRNEQNEGSPQFELDVDAFRQASNG